MRVIICGAGQVGQNLVQSLNAENLNITLVDQDGQKLDKVVSRSDVIGVEGFAAHPDVLEKAGAAEADMIIAVTSSDETNMIICQVAHSYFNVPRKIARIRSQSYLEARGSEFFSRNHMPIDLIISPEYEVARDIAARLYMPGVFDMVRLSHHEGRVVSVKCLPMSDIVNTPIKQIFKIFPDHKFQVLAIVRGGDEYIIPNTNDVILENDEVYFFAALDHVPEVLKLFGHQKDETKRIIVIGGLDVGYYLTKELLKLPLKPKIYLIESDHDRAAYLSTQFPKVSVMNGDALDQEILEEAYIEKADAIVSVSIDDDYNILTSLLGKQCGAKQSIVLMNQINFMPFVNKLGIDSIVSPKSFTVSNIVQYMREKRSQIVHRLRDGWAEVIEVRIPKTSPFIGRRLDTLDLPAKIMIAGIVRAHDVIIPYSSLLIEKQDVLIFLSDVKYIDYLVDMF